MGGVLFGLWETNGIAIASTKVSRDLAGFAFDAKDAAGHTTLKAFAGCFPPQSVPIGVQ